MPYAEQEDVGIILQSTSALGFYINPSTGCGYVNHRKSRQAQEPCLSLPTKNCLPTTCQVSTLQTETARDSPQPDRFSLVRHSLCHFFYCLHQSRIWCRSGNAPSRMSHETIVAQLAHKRLLHSFPVRSNARNSWPTRDYRTASPHVAMKGMTLTTMTGTGS